MDAFGGVTPASASSIERDDIGCAGRRPANNVANPIADDNAVVCIPHRYRSCGISTDDVALNRIVVCSV